MGLALLYDELAVRMKTAAEDLGFSDVVLFRYPYSAVEEEATWAVFSKIRRRKLADS